MSPRTLASIVFSMALVVAFVIYFGTSFPASVPDCHSERGKAAIETVVEDAANRPVDFLRLRETGRTFSEGGKIDSYTCEIVVRSGGSPRSVSVQLKGDDGAVVARQISSIRP